MWSCDTEATPKAAFTDLKIDLWLPSCLLPRKSHHVYVSDPSQALGRREEKATSHPLDHLLAIERVRPDPYHETFLKILFLRAVLGS